MENRTSVSTPIIIGCKLNRDDEKVDRTMYKSMIGSLLYRISSILDITQEVGVLDIFQSNLKETHVNAVKGRP